MTHALILDNLLLMVENTDNKGLPIKYPEFAARVQEAMAEYNIATKDIQKALGITYEMARRYTLGQAMPRSEKMSLLAAALNTDPAQLQYGIIMIDEAHEAFLPAPGRWPFAVSYELFDALPESEKRQVGEYVEFVVNKWHSSAEVKSKKA